MGTLVNKMVALAFDDREGGGTSWGEIVAMVLSGTPTSGLQEQFVRAFIEHPGTIDEFWEAIAGDTAFSAPDIVTLKRLLQWGALARYHAPLVAELESQWADLAEPSASVRDVVVQYDADGWKTILDTEVESVAIGCPPDTPGSTDEERRTNFATILERSVETAFPTAVIAARITDAAAVEDADLILFFSNNPAFEFATTRIAAYLADHGTAMTGIEEVEETTQRLKSLERIFRVTRRYPEMKILLDAGMTSSQSIHRMGRTRFMARFAADLGEEIAEQIFSRACWIASTATSLYTKYGAQLHNVPIFALPDLVTETGEAHPVTADWTTLFGSADTCACKHCRSVYGPAAYLADLLEFLDRQDSKVEMTGDPELPPVYFSARDVLIGYFGTDAEEPIARRPDIANIRLSCENTNTTLPYIDLVNEILEVAVANLVDEPDHLWPEEIESDTTSAELLAEPQVVHEVARNVAYTELANAVHPFDLPFHLWDAEARVYLEHLGLPRYALLETLLLPKKTPVAGIADKIARERLRVSAYGWDVLRSDPITGVDPNDYWGVPPVESPAMW